jgi:hypothetical protein
MPSLRNLGGCGIWGQRRGRLVRCLGKGGGIEERLHLELANGFTDIHAGLLSAASSKRKSPGAASMKRIRGVHRPSYRKPDIHIGTLVTLESCDG